jgi:prepilin-type processing-associated H-X9-DG protein
VYPYVKSKGSYTCPDDTSVATAPAVPISYGYNSQLAYTANLGATGVVPEGFPKLTAPSQSVLLSEVKSAPADPSNPVEISSPQSIGWSAANVVGTQTLICTSGDMGVTGTACGAAGGAATGLHSDGSNFLMADGHVKWLRGEKVAAVGAASGHAPATPTSTGGTQDGNFTATYSYL